MGLQPKLHNTAAFITKKCQCCGNVFGSESYALAKSIWTPDHTIPWCADCVDKYISGETEAALNAKQTLDSEYEITDIGNWRRVNKLCQLADIPFIPNEWVKIWDLNPIGAFGRYAAIFADNQYDQIGWDDYYEEYQALKAANRLGEVLPLIGAQHLKEQQERWGQNYDQEALNYLDHLFNGLMTTQNVNGALQIDQAIKICKLSYEIDCRIREGSDFDKALAAYDKLVKTAEFTPKNVKNVNDFDTIGELIKWMEKKGWRCQYYDDVRRDVVDETMKNIQNFNQRLYTNESGIGDDITHRIEMLQMAHKAANNESEGYYIENSEFDLDNYDNDGYNELIKDEEFNPNMGDDE